MDYNVFIGSFRYGLEWGLGLGSLAWLIGIGFCYSIKIFFHIN